MRSSCSTKSISGALAGAGHARVRAHNSAKRSASARRHSKQGRWPAESAVASSRKNSSVYRFGCIIAMRCRPLNSKRQAIHCRVAQRRLPSVRSGRWKAPPRLPIISPRWGVAMTAPSGATRFWRGTFSLLSATACAVAGLLINPGWVYRPVGSLRHVRAGAQREVVWHWPGGTLWRELERARHSTMSSLPRARDQAPDLASWERKRNSDNEPPAQEQAFTLGTRRGVAQFQGYENWKHWCHPHPVWVKTRT